MGQDAHQCFAGDQSADRPSARAHGNGIVARREESEHRTRRKGQTQRYSSRAAQTRFADHVFGDELRLDKLQRARKSCEGGGGTGDILQYGRGRSAQGLLQVRRKHDRPGRFGQIRRVQGISRNGGGDRDQDGTGRQARHRRTSSRREDNRRRRRNAYDPRGNGRDLSRAASRHIFDRRSAPGSSGRSKKLRITRSPCS